MRSKEISWSDIVKVLLDHRFIKGVDFAHARVQEAKRSKEHSLQTIKKVRYIEVHSGVWNDVSLQNSDCAFVRRTYSAYRNTDNPALAPHSR